MDLDAAMKKAVQKFYEGHAYTEYEKASGKKMKYNKEAFDEIESSIKKKIGPLDQVEEEVEIDG